MSDIRTIINNKMEEFKRLKETRGDTLFTNSFNEIFRIDGEKKQLLIKYGLLYLLIAILTVYLSNLATKKNTFDTEIYLYMSVIIIPIVFLIGLITFSSKEKNKMGIFIYGFFIILFILALIYFYTKLQTLSSTYMGVVSVLSQIIIFGIIIIGLTLFYDLFKSKLQDIPGPIGIFVDFIFFIPCLLHDFTVYLKTEFTTTPSVTYVLLLLEVVLIVLYVYLPMLFTSGLYNSVTILDRPKFLQNRNVLANGNDLPKTDKNLHYVNYSISLWLFLNNQELSKFKKHIFSYGTDKFRIEYITERDSINESVTESLDKSFKLKITLLKNDKCENLVDMLENDTAFSDASFVNVNLLHEKYNENCAYMSYDDFTYNMILDSNNDTEWRVSLETLEMKSEISTYIDIEFQKWNNIVVNYNNNTADLFINGVLVFSENYANMYPVYKDTDIIAIGDEHMSGAICNIEYHNKVLTESDIITYYNLLINQNPPLNNIL